MYHNARRMNTEEENKQKQAPVCIIRKTRKKNYFQEINYLDIIKSVFKQKTYLIMHHAEREKMRRKTR